MTGIRCLLACLFPFGANLPATEDPGSTARSEKSGGARAEEGADPSDLYFQGWLLSRDAGKLKDANQSAASLEKFERALGIFKQIAKDHAAWKPEMVRSRIASTEGDIARLKTGGK